MKVSEAPEKHCTALNSALLFACLGAAVNSLTVSSYLGLLWFLARENCFHARWNCKNPSLWLSSHTGGHSDLSSLVTHKPRSGLWLQSQIPCTPPAALSFCCNKLDFQNQFTFSLPISADFTKLCIFPFTFLLFFLFITVSVSKLFSSVFVLLITSLSSSHSAKSLSTYPIHRPRQAAILKILHVQTSLCKHCPSYLQEGNKTRDF